MNKSEKQYKADLAIVNDFESKTKGGKPVRVDRVKKQFVFEASSGKFIFVSYAAFRRYEQAKKRVNAYILMEKNNALS